MPLLAGLAANMVAVPISSFITFPAGLFACLMMPLGLEKWPLWVTEKSIDVIMATAQSVIDWPLAAWQGGAVPAWFLAPVTLGGLWFCFWRGKMRAAGLVPIGVAIALLPLTSHPDVLVADDAGLFAVRDEAGKLWVSSARREKFVRNEWLQLEGGTEDYETWPENGVAGNGFLACDGAACEYRMKGQSVSFVWQPEGLPHSCKNSAVIFSSIDLDPAACRDKILRDENLIHHFGAQAVYLKPEGIKITSVRETRGQRPWTGETWRGNNSRWKPRAKNNQ